MTTTLIFLAMWIPLKKKSEPLTEIVAKINQTNATIESQTASLLDILGQLHGTTPEGRRRTQRLLWKHLRGNCHLSFTFFRIDRSRGANPISSSGRSKWKKT